MRTLAALLALLSFLPHWAEAVDIGEPMPAFAFSDASSHELNVSSFRGKVIYLDFWASWCKPCGKSLPWMNSLQQKFGEQGLTVLAINLDSEREQAEKILQRIRPEFFVGFDPEGKSPELYGVQAMPSSFLIDRDGTVVSTFDGFRESETQVIESKIASMLRAEK